MMSFHVQSAYFHSIDLSFFCCLTWQTLQQYFSFPPTRTQTSSMFRICCDPFSDEATEIVSRCDDMNVNKWNTTQRQTIPNVNQSKSLRVENVKVKKSSNQISLQRNNYFAPASIHQRSMSDFDEQHSSLPYHHRMRACIYLSTCMVFLE